MSDLSRRDGCVARLFFLLFLLSLFFLSFSLFSSLFRGYGRKEAAIGLFFFFSLQVIDFSGVSRKPVSWTSGFFSCIIIIMKLYFMLHVHSEGIHADS